MGRGGRRIERGGWKMDGWVNNVDAVYGVGRMACVGGLLSWRSGLQESVSVQISEI